MNLGDMRAVYDARVSRKWGVTLAEYHRRIQQGDMWCRRHRGWAAPSSFSDGQRHGNSGICLECDPPRRQAL